MALMFLLAAAPPWLATGAAAVVLDQLVAQEIAARNRRAKAALNRHLTAEKSRVQQTLDRMAEDPALTRLIGQLDATNPSVFEGVAARLAASAGFDILAIAAARGPWDGLLLSSAHLSEAAEDPVPAFAANPAQARVGVVYETVDGNPIQQVPALVGFRTVRASGLAAPALHIYGGIRLDGPRLEGLAEMSEMQLTLRAPGLGEWRFGDADTTVTPSRLVLPFIPGGTATAPQPVQAPAAILEIQVGSPRLAEVRRQVLRWAPVIIGGSLLLAIGLSWMLSRRITQPLRTLSTAAESIAGGDLSVRVKQTGRDEVGHLMAVFNHMTTELTDSRERLRRAERAAAWQQIARRVAHEIKNPLFPIQMSIETLQKSFEKQHPKLPEIVRESTKTVLEEVHALNRLVTEFSKFARLPPPEKEPVAVGRLFAHVLELYGSDGRVVADTDAVDTLPALNVDREQMNRVLINLVKNALEAIGDGPGEVRLDAKAEPRGYVTLSVTDSGPGMTPSIQDEMFTPYFTTKPDGTGLGLAIVDRIVDEHGGEIQVRTGDRGTTFALRLPTAVSETLDTGRFSRRNLR